MSSTSALTVQAIADMLGIILSKPTLCQTLAQETEDLIQQYIRSASLLATNSRSHRLSAQHINRVLISEHNINRIFPSDDSNHRHQRLYGYEFCPVGQYTPVPFEQSELYLPREHDLNLKDIAKSEVPPIPNSQDFPFQFLLTEGVFADKKMLSNRRLIVKAPKLIERSVSAPLNQLQQSAPPVELVRHAPFSIINKVYDQNSIVRDVLSNNLLIYFVKTVDVIRDDTPIMRDSALSYLETDTGLQQLLPYFLQYIIGNMTLHYQNVPLMDNLLKLTQSLIKNESLYSHLYVQPILKIVFSCLVGNDNTTSLHGDDKKLRDHAAYVLQILLDKYEDCYLDIRSCVFNSLVNTIFDPNTSLMAHYGAICGIEAIGQGAVARIVPHMRHYLQMVNMEVRSCNARQRMCAQLVRDKTIELITGYDAYH
ncbi:hypothetical protein TRFO_32633 [Tritrichomonas foetus]|uniref:TAF6 C-terminal HEAT repeat domain-containing protein n=1 Tax=Tritrichomonas foetus TaxID=1144522 RepID=A0A1J4JNK0_9EUKA|nr:hypothetical protein TRFO_32633 [Tritrichomonas foetus]|eukprot:OHT00659.1 hypothetical protein TRFO_32633 [Tritrichomonas foetus]